MHRVPMALRYVPLLLLFHACAEGATLRTERLASGLSRPVFATSPPGATGRLFVVEQHTGRIKIIDLNTETVRSDPFLDLDGLATGNEQGLLGLAFDPDYTDNAQTLSSRLGKILRIDVDGTNRGNYGVPDGKSNKITS